MNDLGLPSELVHRPRQPVVKAGAQRDDQVGLAERQVGVGFAVHPRHPQAERVRFVHRPNAQQRSDHRHVGLFRQPEQIILCAGQHHAVPGNDQRPFGGCNQLGHALDIAAQIPGRQPIAGQVDLIRVHVIDLGRLGILGNVNQHRARPAGASDVKRLADSRGQLAHIGHQVVVFGDRQGDGSDIHFLKSIGPDHRRSYLPGDGDHRGRIHVGGSQPGDQVGGPRAGGGHTDPYPAAGAGIPIGRVGGRLLVARQHVVDGIIRQRVIQVNHRPTRNTKDDLHSLPHQALPDDLCSCQSHLQLAPFCAALPSPLFIERPPHSRPK